MILNMSCKSYFLFFLILIITTKTNSQYNATNKLLVQTKTGWVRGIEEQDIGVDYLAFRGIPFAEAPIGRMRFKPPIPKFPWNGIFNASEAGILCMQPGKFPYTADQSEDCLNLNVFVPAKDFNQLLPVYFFLHGGDLLKGSCNDFGPQFLLKEDLIYVASNYRLNSFGFLSLDIPDATGNNGLKDAILALEWVQENIANFGGDPKKVTLAGLSAGSALTNYLLLTEKTKGLFRNAILDNGAALGNRFSPDPVKYAKILSKLLCNNITDEYSILRCLLRQNPSDIIEAETLMGINDPSLGYRPYVPFLPVAEIESKHRVLKEKPIITLRNGLKQNVPVLVGHDCEEGLRMYRAVKKNATLIDLLNEDPTRYVPRDLYKLTHSERQSVAAAIKQFYFNGGNITIENLDPYYSLVMDAQYFYPINSWILLHKNNPQSNNIFYFNFCFDGRLNLIKRFSNIKHAGATHTDHATYYYVIELFNFTSIVLRFIDERTKITLERMIAMWTSFVKTGNPTPDNFEIIWKPSQSPFINHLSITENLENIPHRPYEARYKFWNTIYSIYYNKYID